MGGISIWHWLIVLAIVLVLFGNRLPNVMGDLAKGIKNFKAGLKDDESSDEAEKARLADASKTASTTTAAKDEATRN